MPESSTVRIHLMDRAVDVPAGLTILKAAEHAGQRTIRGAGCRAGFCGACATLYRPAGGVRMEPALACQTTVEDGMVLAQLPFVPAHRRPYQLSELSPVGRLSWLPSLYPELARCVQCNACTRVCPQNLDVMEYVALALRDDLAGVTRESFDCVQCGLCAVRCPADIPQFHVAQVARRLLGRYRRPPAPELAARVAEVEAGAHRAALDELLALDSDALRARYRAREIEA